MAYGRMAGRPSRFSTPPLPVLFLAHGSPMMALEPGEYAGAMEELARVLPRARAAVVVSAHWASSRSLGVTAALKPEQLHDFAGFPLELYRVRYRPPGDPQLARQLVARLDEAGFKAHAEIHRGLDHGVWVPLRFLYPRAGVPVVQVALPQPASVERLLDMGAALAPLRREGVLIIGSGGMVHNFEVMQLGDANAPAQPWAREFEQWMLQALESGDRDALIHYREQAPFALLAAKESEHLDPLFVAAGAAGAGAPVRIVHQQMQYGNLSLLSLAFGT